MTMNHDEFESRLKRTPLKPPPGEWREQILAADNACRQTPPVRGLTFSATWRTRLRELFWPHPVAWGALASIWLVIGAVQLALREPTPTTTRIYVATSPNAPTVLQLQRELVTAWNGPVQKPRPKPEASLPPQSCIEHRRKTSSV